METIDSVLATADRALRRYGIGTTDRAALIADLRLDLQAAAGDGISPAQLIGSDVADFARRLADEAGLARVPSERSRLLGTTLVGSTIGAVIGGVLLAVAYPLLVRWVDLPRSFHVPVQVAVLVYYGVPAIMVVAAAVIAVRLTLRTVPQIRDTAKAMMLLLPLAGIVITPLTMAFARSTGYSTAAPVLVAEIAMVLGAISGATLLARRWSLRDRRRAMLAPPSDVPLS
ncbi:hypothetical protein [Plantactinospora soyae]|uniref:Membrane protein n=1 Tax=Plantactinospora soyae TaxID=1544732 RepID=A0A927R8E8_9ACTN|nr:hypothetical protein [Plantactinospora soyae]MBE1490364.1 putative membrane protein [Plantactinospora soyae]